MLASPIALIASLDLAFALCYSITSIAAGYDVQPCNNIEGVTSMCCTTNRSSTSGFTQDTCLPNGLCQNVFTNLTTKKLDTNYWRERCTDTTWGSPYCLKNICWGYSDITLDGSGNAEMTPCDGTPTSEKWCCGTHNTACCGTDKEIALASVIGVPNASSNVSSTSKSTSTSTPTGSSTATQSFTPSSIPKMLALGAKVGIGIGVVIICLATVLGALCFCWKTGKWDKAKRDAPVTSEGFMKAELPGSEVPRYGNAALRRTDLWRRSEMVELDGLQTQIQGGNIARIELP